MEERWFPHVTVAAVVEDNGRYLMVEEQVDGELRWNQPAGHLESGESIEQACLREALEETGYTIRTTSVCGIYLWKHPENGESFLRIGFSAEVVAFDASLELDAGIQRAVWLTPQQLRDCADLHRSPLVMRCLNDHIAGKCYPLSLLSDMVS